MSDPTSHIRAVTTVEPRAGVPIPVFAASVEQVESVPSRPGFFRRVCGFIGSVSEWLFGAAALVLGLSILAALPLAQFLTLGYLLEAGGRVARSGRLRDGFIGVRQSARLGSIALGCLLCWLPLWLLASLATSAQIIDPNGPIAQRWDVVLTVLGTLVGLHIAAACLRGGRLRSFFWPFNVLWLLGRLCRGGVYTQARDAVWDFVTALRLPYYFWLGLRGFAGAFVWLLLPLLLFGQANQKPGVGIVGGVLLAVVLLYVPFLQIRFARDNRFRALFELRAVRADFCQAPVAFAVAMFVTLLFALPLYALKIEMIPREVLFLESLVFLAFIFPARLLTGWAYGRASRREPPRHWCFRWTSRLLMLPMVAFYVFVLFFAQHLAWCGISSLYEQHAFLLPVPFTGMKD
jgi:hypothetical protein